MATTMQVQAERAGTLDEIDLRICRLFALVVDGIRAATTAFVGGDAGAGRRVVAADELVDRLRDGTEELLDRQIVTMASSVEPEGLGRLVLALRIVPELERSGDLVEHIASRSDETVAVHLSPSTVEVIQRMGDLGGEMWRRAGATFGGVDDTTGDDLHRLDDEMDELHGRLMDEVRFGGMPATVAIDVGLVARFYERLGDHAVNVARRVEAHDRRFFEL